MSRKGDCWDNAPMESLFHTFKTERIHHRVYATRAEARRNLSGWSRHAKAAAFKGNDQLLEVLPLGVVVFPDSGICNKLADEVGKRGIPLFDLRKGGGGWAPRCPPGRPQSVCTRGGRR